MTELRAARTSAGTLRASTLQFLSFVLVGAAGTLLHYLALTVLVVLGILPPGLASAVGAALGACVNYWLNYRFTFASSTRRHREMMPRYFAIAAIGAVANGLIVSQLSALGMHFLVAQLIATGTILVLNFLISKKWIFQKKK
jgi:putative flippase GtrA